MRNDILLFFSLIFFIRPVIAAEGIYFSSHETSAFISCGTSEIWWLDGRGDGMDNLSNIYSELVTDPYGSMYVVIEGTFDRIEGNGDYVGVVTVEKVLNYSLEHEVILNCVPNIESLK